MSAWVALMVAAPFWTPSLLVSTEKESAPILIVATPAFTPVIWPMVAPVLSFTDMPLAISVLAPALAAVSAVDPVGAVDDGAVELGDAGLGLGGAASEGGGGVLELGDVDCASAGAAKAKAAVSAR